MNYITVEEMAGCQFQGIIMDNELKWPQNIAAVRSKMPKDIGVM